ncbi:MAG: DUF1501 domain-containing protein, partial [Planctomycetota bacterium]
MIPLRELIDRRRFLSQTASGLSSIALTSLLAEQGLLASEKQEAIRPNIDPQHPNASRKPHFAPRAKNVLMIFCAGACSHLDTFDFKPELVRLHNQPMPGGEKLITFQGEQGTIQQSPWRFKPRGESGKMVSTLVDH